MRLAGSHSSSAGVLGRRPSNSARRRFLRFLSVSNVARSASTYAPTTSDTGVSTAKVNRPFRGNALGLLCALVVTLNAAVWMLITPSFQVPDEPQHIAYAQHLAETGKLPQHTQTPPLSDELLTALNSLESFSIIGNGQRGTHWDAERDRQTDSALAGKFNRKSGGGSSSAVNNPPLFYMGEALAYNVAGGSDFLTRLLAMRTFSVLLAGVTAFFIFLFLREVFPTSRRVWVVGTLAAGLQPAFGFISSGVNNDVGMATLAAACLWALARIFRRGLDVRSGALLGIVFGLGLITKATLLGFAPGIFLAALFLLRRQWSTTRRAAVYGVLAGLAATLLPVALYFIAINTVWERALWAGGVLPDASSTAVGVTPSISHFLSYLWQFYLPPLPFMEYRIGHYPLWETWFKAWIGRFGWLDYGFPVWVYKFALIFAAVATALVVRAGVVYRSVIKNRLDELLCYFALIGGLLLTIGVMGYQYRINTGFVFEQARYLFPILALFAGFVVLVVKGAGKRFEGLVGSLIIVVTLAHGLAALVITVNRYYL